MKMLRTAAVTVDMKVHAPQGEATQKVGAECNQHEAHGQLKHLFMARGNASFEPEHQASDRHQREGMAYPPSHSDPQDLRLGILSGDERRHGG